MHHKVIGIKVTPQMTSKWVKAAFLVMLGIVLLYYAQGFVDDLERNTADEFNVSFEWTWDLLSALIWILIAWLFVDAALIIALSFRAEAHTLTDVMRRLDSIEKRLPKAEVPRIARAPVLEEMQPAVPVVEEEPPPPLE